MTSRLRRRRLILCFLLLGSVTAVGVGIAGALSYVQFEQGIHRSAIIDPATGKAITIDAKKEPSNVLIMGLDSRQDQNGDALSEEQYRALLAGGHDDGGMNANVLMLIHLPGERGQGVGFSIPRDSYTTLAGQPLGVNTSKVKEAYGLRFTEKMQELRKDTGHTPQEKYQIARTAARQAQIDTVTQLTGQPIHHYVEVTMAGFYELIKQYQPLTVCVNQATEDKYSGAKFVAGPQEINAQQSLSFVRQRRDTGKSGLLLTDFDRTKRQQALLLSLGEKMKSQDLFQDIAAFRELMSVTHKYISVDNNFDLPSFALKARKLSNGTMKLITIPMVKFERIHGKDVNIVDPAAIQKLIATEIASADAQDAAEGAQPGTSGEEPAHTDSSPSSAPSTLGGSGSSGTVSTPSNTPANGSDGPAAKTTWETPLISGSRPCVN